MLAAERKRCWRSARRASVTSSMMLTASTTVPCSSRTGVALVTAQRSSPVALTIVCVSAGRGSSPASAWRPGRSRRSYGRPSSSRMTKAPSSSRQRHREHLLGRRAAHHLGGGLVDVDERPVGRLHRHGGGEVGEHRLELALRAAQLGEQPRVVEGERRAARDLARQLGVGVVVVRRAPEAHEAQHADRPSASDQRHRQRGRVPGARHQLQVLVVDGEGAQALGPDLVLQVRAARARRDGDGVRAAGVERIARARGVQHLQRARIGRVGGGLAELAVVDEVDDAQLGHVGHGHPDDLAQHRLGLGRRLEQLAGPGHEVRAPARGALGDERLLVAAPADRGEHGERAARGDHRHLADVLGREEAVVGEAERDRARHRQHAPPRACSAARRARPPPAAR